VIVVFGAPRDPVLKFACWIFESKGLQFRRFLVEPDTVTSPDGVNLENDISWKESTGVYIRWPTVLNSDDRAKLPIYSNDWPYACPRQFAAYLESLPCIVVNKASKALANQSKTSYLELIRGSGLEVPLTLITSDLAEARKFISECGGRVVLKALSAQPSTVQLIEANHLERINLETNPIQLQQVIQGDDIRVHVVGNRWFATRIVCEEIDYRSAFENGLSFALTPTTLPDRVISACTVLVARLGLHFAGIDLKEAGDGRYFCFEVNPSPSFNFFQLRTGQPIGTALAELLTERTGQQIIPLKTKSERTF
jgi:glutathione synthase/RimK-type ligase-like ATP-grasp enzyme